MSLASTPAGSRPLSRTRQVWGTWIVGLMRRALSEALFIARGAAPSASAYRTCR